MPRTLQWRELKTGLIALAAIVSLAISVLLFARVGALHGDTTNIFVLTDDAPGVLNGTEVWLSGEKIGLVKDVHFRPITTDTLQRLAIHAEILSDRLYLIRKDAYADIRPGGNLIGSPVVFIASGTSRAPALTNGDTLVTRSTGKMKPVGERVSALGDRITTLADSTGRVLTLLNSQVADLGKLGQNGRQVAATSGQLFTLLGKTTQGEGSIALAARGDIQAHVSRIRAVKDSITYLVSSGNGSIGRLRRDSTLISTVSRLRSQLDSLRSTYSGAGTISHARSDTALTAEMARMRTELAALMADLKKHPRRYISF
jgi:phospholipid/cholesterol/gamma-HCH transport system substrate-binding protein